MRGAGDEGMRIDQHRLELGIDVRVTVKEEEAGLRGDGDPDLVGEVEPACSLEALLVEEHLDEPLELRAIGRRKNRVEMNAAGHEGNVVLGKGPRPDRFAAAMLEEVEHGNDCTRSRKAGRAPPW